MAALVRVCVCVCVCVCVDGWMFAIIAVFCLYWWSPFTDVLSTDYINAWCRSRYWNEM